MIRRILWPKQAGVTMSTPIGEVVFDENGVYDCENEEMFEFLSRFKNHGVVPQIISEEEKKAPEKVLEKVVDGMKASDDSDEEDDDETNEEYEKASKKDKKKFRIS